MMNKKQKEQAARLTNSRATCIGVCVNTSGLGRDTADALLVELNQRLGLPCVDPLVHGVEAIVDKLV